MTDTTGARTVGEDSVLVAVADSTSVIASDDLRLALGLNVQLAVAAGVELDAEIRHAHRVVPERFGLEIVEESVPDRPPDRPQGDARG